jgi:2-methylisocitrate lyase-like PEP mutase family enzyme
VMRTVREIERTGAAALHIEDQIYPKRAHYHKGIEHIIPRQEMVGKIKAAIQARTDPEMTIIARTDAMKTDGFSEGVIRANIYLEAGADMVTIFPNTVEEVHQAPKEIHGYVHYLNSIGNRLRRPIFPVKELEDMGYKAVGFSAILICAAAQQVKHVLSNIHSRGVVGLEEVETVRWRKEAEDLIGLEDYYRIEQETVER